MIVKICRPEFTEKKRLFTPLYYYSFLFLQVWTVDKGGNAFAKFYLNLYRYEDKYICFILLYYLLKVNASNLKLLVHKENVNDH